MNYQTYTRFFVFALIGILASISISSAQDTNPAQRRGQGGGQFIAMEKQMVLDSIPDLNEDQKLIINAVYDDYEKSLASVRSEATGEREVMREKMTGIRDSKNEAMKAVLSEKQYAKYEVLLTRRRSQMQNRRPNN